MTDVFGVVELKGVASRPLSALKKNESKEQKKRNENNHSSYGGHQSCGRFCGDNGLYNSLGSYRYLVENKRHNFLLEISGLGRTYEPKKTEIQARCDLVFFLVNRNATFSGLIVNP